MDYTLCGNADVVDRSWHHVAVQRRFSDGVMSIYVDGVRDAEGPMSKLSFEKSRKKPIMLQREDRQAT